MSFDERFQGVFRQVMGDADLVVTDSTTADDIPEWDSLLHVSLIYSMESEFGITFSYEELAGFADVGAMRKAILNRVQA